MDSKNQTYTPYIDTFKESLNKGPCISKEDSKLSYLKNAGVICIRNFIDENVNNTIILESKRKRNLT